MAKKHKRKLRKLERELRLLTKRHALTDTFLLSLFNGHDPLWLEHAGINSIISDRQNLRFIPRADQMTRIAEARAILKPIAQRLKIVA